MYIYIYIYLKWPLFLKVNPAKQSLFKPKQGSFGFQVYLNISRWWFQLVFIFAPTWGNDPIWRAYFFNWVVQPPTRYICIYYILCTYRFWKPQLEMILRCLKPDKTTLLTTRRSRAFSRAPWADSTWASTGSETCWGVLRFVWNTCLWCIFGPIWTYLANMAKRLQRIWDCIWM